LWVAYIATGWSDFLGQMRMDAARFNLFDARFYIDNILHGSGPISLDWAARSIRALPPTRVGTWTMVIGTPAAVAVALYRARDASAGVVRALAVAFLLQLTMFVAVLKVKSVTYMIALWPLAALLLAWLGAWLWDRKPLPTRVALATLLGL